MWVKTPEGNAVNLKHSWKLTIDRRTQVHTNGPDTAAFSVIAWPAEIQANAQYIFKGTVEECMKFVELTIERLNDGST